MSPRPCKILAILSLLLLIAAPAAAAPRDTKVGDVRVVFRPQGIPIKAAASSLGAAVAVLPYGTKVRVLEVGQESWMRVSAAGKTGWMRTFEAVELAALSRPASPAHVAYGKAPPTSQREASAVGRRLDAGTETRYRTSRRDLAAAYRAVDDMERASAAVAPSEAIAFIMDGNLGRVGRDFARPRRLPAEPLRARRGGRVDAGGIGRVAGGIGRRIGLGNRGSKVLETGASMLAAAHNAYAEGIQKKFTVQQEYYLGRAVAAQAIARYGLDQDARRRHYVRLVGEALVRVSRLIRPTFGGYHFDVLATDEVNAISGPGGFVLITRGAVMACRNEAELAGVLAHELAHITDQHGEKLLRETKNGQASLKMAVASIAQLGKAVGGGAGQVIGISAQAFGGIVNNVSGTAINHAYGRRLETVADELGTRILFGAYYDHDGLRSFLARLGQTRHGATSTHADPSARAQHLLPFVARFRFPYDADPETRELQAERFRKATGVTAR